MPLRTLDFDPLMPGPLLTRKDVRSFFWEPDLSPPLLFLLLRPLLLGGAGRAAIVGRRVRIQFELQVVEVRGHSFMLEGGWEASWRALAFLPRGEAGGFLEALWVA